MTALTDERTQHVAIARVVVIATIVSFGALSLLPWTFPMAMARVGILAGFACLFAIAFAVRAYAAAHCALIGLCYLAPMMVPGLGYRWPLPSIVTLVLYGTIVRFVPALRASARFATRGTLDRTTKILSVTFVVMAATALVVWRFASGADMSVYRAFIPPSVPTWLIFVAIVPYAMLNAIFEETIWRGALWEGCHASLGRMSTLVLTSMSFGLAHYHGFPSGVIGVGLATIYGFMTGIVRMRTAGLFWPWLVHVFADVVIFTLIAAMVVA
jgi:membrane protease YdiL (CAAX protease family)